MAQSVKNAYINSTEFNVVLVDWSVVAGSNYLTAKYYVPDVSRLIGKCITFMVENVGLDVSKLGLVGHSLGAHVAGVAGKALNGTVNRLIGKWIN